MKNSRLLLPLSLTICGIGISSFALAVEEPEEEVSNDGNSFEWSVGSWTGGVPSLFNTAYILGGTVTVGGDVEVGHIRLTGGFLAGKPDAVADSLTLAGHSSNSIWSGGGLRELSLTISQNAALNISDSGGNHLNGATLVIERDDGAGEANWTQGKIQMDNGSKIENSGVFNDSASDRVFTFTGTKGIFHNESDGVYNKTGSGTTELDVTFNNDGSVNVDSGTLELGGGGTHSSTGTIELEAGTILRFSNSYTVEDASTLTGDGLVELTNGTLTLDGQVSVSDFAIKSGFLTGTHTFNNGATWSEGTIKDGSTTNASTSTFNIQTAAAENNFQNHAFTNDGIVSWTDGDIQGDSGTTITNNGTFTPIPEPSTWALMMLGLGIVGMRATRRTRRS